MPHNTQPYTIAASWSTTGNLNSIISNHSFQVVKFPNCSSAWRCYIVTLTRQKVKLWEKEVIKYMKWFWPYIVPCLFFVVNATGYSISSTNILPSVQIKTLWRSWTCNPVGFATVFKFQRDISMKILTSALCQKNENGITRSEQMRI